MALRKALEWQEAEFYKCMIGMTFFSCICHMGKKSLKEENQLQITAVGGNVRSACSMGKLKVPGLTMFFQLLAPPWQAPHWQCSQFPSEPL